MCWTTFWTGLVSVETAKRDYGVVIANNFVDAAATDKLRKA